jgi:hypothetical protein
MTNDIESQNDTESQLTDDTEYQLTNDAEYQDSVNINLKQRICTNCGKVLFPIFVLICIMMYLIFSPIISIALLVIAICTCNCTVRDIQIFYLTLLTGMAFYAGLVIYLCSNS